MSTTSADDVLVAMAFGPSGTWTASPGFALEIPAPMTQAAGGVQARRLSAMDAFAPTFVHSSPGNAVRLAAFKSQ